MIIYNNIYIYDYVKWLYQFVQGLYDLYDKMYIIMFSSYVSPFSPRTELALELLEEDSRWTDAEAPERESRVASSRGVFKEDVLGIS
jgi:hypothetical protein